MRPVSPSDFVFERCPALWHASRVRRLDAGNRFTRIGNACHAACDAVTRAVLGEDGRELYLVARDAVTAHADEVDLPPDEMHEALDVMDSATAADSAISFYVPDGWTAKAEVDLALDSEFVVRPLELPPTEPEAAAPVAYRARLDRLQWSDEGQLEVWDWTASHDYVSGEELRLDVRARFSSMLALAWFPAATVVTFKRVMLRLGYTATAKFVCGERWHGQIQDRARRLRSAINKCERDVIAPGGVQVVRGGQAVWEVQCAERVGSWCRTCPVRGNCASYAKARTYGAELDMDVPRVAVAERLLAVKAAAAELDARLREDVQLHGPIQLGDGTALGMFPKRSMALRGDRAEVLAELRRMGMDEDQERAWFVPSDRAMPGLVKAAIEKLEKSPGMRDALASRVLAASTGFEFTVKETEDA